MSSEERNFEESGANDANDANDVDVAAAAAATAAACEEQESFFDTLAEDLRLQHRQQQQQQQPQEFGELDKEGKTWKSNTQLNNYFQFQSINY